MKTIVEVYQWCEGAAREFGDPSDAIGQLFVRYVDGDQVPRKIAGCFELFCFLEGNELVLWLGPQLIIPISISRDGPEQDECGDLKCFGVDSISRGVCALKPSLNIPGEIHAFVILYDVPAPAPWERLIILPGEAA